MQQPPYPQHTPPPYPPYTQPPQQSNTLKWVIGSIAGCLGCAVLAFVVPMLVSLGLFAGMRGTMDQMSQRMDQERKARMQAERELDVREHRMVSAGGKRFLVGSVQNRSKTRTYDLIRAEFWLYDKAGQRLPLLSAETQGLKPGAVWRLKVPVRDKRAVRNGSGRLNFESGDVTGFRMYNVLVPGMPDSGTRKP
jgi:hypothetical protein